MKFTFHKIINNFMYRPFLKIKLKKVGSNFRLGYLSEIKNPQYFEFGDNFYCGPFAFFGTNKNNPVKIGDYVMFGPKSTIQGGNHDIEYTEKGCDTIGMQKDFIERINAIKKNKIHWFR